MKKSRKLAWGVLGVVITLQLGSAVPQSDLSVQRLRAALAMGRLPDLAMGRLPDLELGEFYRFRGEGYFVVSAVLSGNEGTLVVQDWTRSECWTPEGVASLPPEYHLSRQLTRDEVSRLRKAVRGFWSGQVVQDHRGQAGNPLSIEAWDGSRYRVVQCHSSRSSRELGELLTALSQ